MSRNRRQWYLWAVVLGWVVLLTGCSSLPKGDADLDVKRKELGLTSWYGESFHGRLTASGEPFATDALTAAHRTLPLGTVLQVTNLANGRRVRVRINDRGPYVHGRILDLSYSAAQELGIIESGTSPVYLEVVRPERGDGRGAEIDSAKTVATIEETDTLLDAAEVDDAWSGNTQMIMRAPREGRLSFGSLEDVWWERRPRRQVALLGTESPP